MGSLSTQMIESFKSFFLIPDIPLGLVLVGLAIALLFGAIWIAAYYPTILKETWLWIMLIAGFLFTAIFTAFLQIPLQYASTKICDIFLSHQNMVTYTLVASVPAMIIASIIQVGAKLLPVVIYWLAIKRNMEPKTALLFGVFAGAGIGIVEAFQVHSQLFSYGWSLSLIQTNGILVILPFIERFLIIGFHIGAIAIAAYGLAKGKWWQYSLVIVALYFILNYTAVLMGTQVLAVGYVELIIFVIAILTAAAALWLRWNKPKQTEPAVIK
jgi:hypothetical protein